MKDFNTEWSKDELKAYILIYCSLADFVEMPKEIAYIKSKLKDLDIEHIHEECEKDNDYQSIQKIQSTLIRYHYSHEEIDELINDIKELFTIDGEFDILEKNLYLGIKRLLIQTENFNE